MMLLDVFIPLLPPGINSQYGRNWRGRVFKSSPHREWAEQAALLIGARAAALGWLPSPDAEYSIKIIIHNSRLDVDASVKLILDTVTQKLGFDDRRVAELHVKKGNLRGIEGISILIEPGDGKGWGEQNNGTIY